VGGVLVRTEDRSHRQRLEKRLGLARGEADELVFNSEHGTNGQLGAITAADLWTWVAQHLALDAEGLAQFWGEFFAGDTLDTELVAHIRRLRPRYQTAIISNAMDDLLHNVTHIYPMADAFDLIIGSAYERIMKPDARIFQRTLERLGRAADEAVFIDDFAHNIEGARAVGMSAIHFTPTTNLLREFAALGIVN
jgi:putative hydrolase of the HAD superfamily